MQQNGTYLDQVWQKFTQGRKASLFGRFPGFYRSVIVDTNDPLNMNRVRFKCPELHDFTLKAVDCPWASPAPWLGGKNAGSWASPIIEDIIWITWEKNHPYGPIWTGAADETRLRRYVLEFIHGRTPVALKEDGSADESPDDFLEEYLPKDGRPMSSGMRDRYGNVDITRSIGFFPIEHKEEPAAAGTDAVSEQNFETSQAPEVNDPDQKYWIRATKYGGYEIISDVGYHWQKPAEGEEDPDELGEFVGSFIEDIDFEVERTKFLTRLWNEDKPTGSDQRRYEVRTRAGHMFQMRDVGWAQMGGAVSKNEVLEERTKTRGDYGDPRTISKNKESDERWWKVRSKGGHIIQAMDMGFHPEEDKFYARSLVEEVGPGLDEEEGNWTKRDARQLRVVTRYGLKFVLDDRGSDPKDADGPISRPSSEEQVKANGWFLKTRRGWKPDGTGDEGESTGFGFEANDKDKLNTTRWYTPASKIIEMNDAKGYVMAATDTATEISRTWQKLKENEFALKIAMTENPELDTYHLKLDKHNGYLRLKSAAGGDNGRRPPDALTFAEFIEGGGVRKLFDAETGINQGLEVRDGRVPEQPIGDGAWVELVDIDDRGLWFSRKQGLAVLRSNDNQSISIIDGTSEEDTGPALIIRNNVDGPLQIFCLADVQVIGKNVAIEASQKISLKAGNEISFQAGGTQAVLNRAGFGTTEVIRGREIQGFLPGAQAGPGAQSASPTGSSPLTAKERKPGQIKPFDRGITDGTRFDEVDESVVTGVEDEADE